jgi:hypothetical protein
VVISKSGFADQVHSDPTRNKSKAVPLHDVEAHGGRGDLAPTHTLPRH